MTLHLGTATSRVNTGVNKPDDVPMGKQPKSRAPSGLRERILRTPLPYYSGPYTVGMMDLEVPVRHPRHFSHITRNKRHLLKLETVLFTVFYPSDFGSGNGQAPDGEKKWSRPTWLPRPRLEIAKGYGRFAGIPAVLSVPWFCKSFFLRLFHACRGMSMVSRKNREFSEHFPFEPRSRRFIVVYSTERRLEEHASSSYDAMAYHL